MILGLYEIRDAQNAHRTSESSHKYGVYLLFSASAVQLYNNMNHEHTLFISRAALWVPS